MMAFVWGRPSGFFEITWSKAFKMTSALSFSERPPGEGTAPGTGNQLQ